jgi:hypothetical protein
VRIRGQADAEMDVGLSPLGLSARADRSDDLAFLDRGPGRHADRAEMHERDRVAVRRANREAETLMGKLARERDDAGGGRPDLGRGRRRNVDPPVLPAGIWVALRDERAQD